MTVKRHDKGELKRATRLANGWLRTDAYLTRVGVFPYRTPDGKIRRELRLPEEVFDSESLASFGLVPVTDDHPKEFLDGKNTVGLSRGTTDSNVVADGKFVRATVQITDEALIKKVDGGKRELSCGYSCELEFVPGEYEGQRYDAIQRKIRGNHVAVVAAGRAGPEVRIHLDAADAVQVTDENESLSNADGRTVERDRKMAVKTFKVDGIEFTADEQIASVVAALQAKLDSVSTDGAAKLTAALADVEKEKARADKATEDLAQAKKDLADAPEKVRAEIQARMDLEAKASKVLGDEKLDAKLDAKAIKLKVLAKLAPDVKLDEKPDAYVDARFDMAIEDFEKSPKGKSTPKLDAVRATADGRTAKADSELSAADARAAMIEQNRNAWKQAASSKS